MHVGLHTVRHSASNVRQLASALVRVDVLYALVELSVNRHCHKEQQILQHYTHKLVHSDFILDKHRRAFYYISFTYNDTLDETVLCKNKQ